MILTFLFVTLLGFPLGYYLYVYMSSLERSILSNVLRISIKIFSVFMRAIGFPGGSGLFRTVMFQALNFLGGCVILSPGYFTWARVLCTYSNSVAAHILNLYNCTEVLVIEIFTHSISVFRDISVKSVNWTHRNTTAYSYFSEINLHVSVWRCL